MFSRRQPTASRLERRRAAVAVACDIFTRRFSERKIPRRSALTSRRGLNSTCHGLGADVTVHKAAPSPLRRQSEQFGEWGNETSKVRVDQSKCNSEFLPRLL